MHTTLHTGRFVRSFGQRIAALAFAIACISLVARAQVKAEDYPPPKPAFPAQTNAPAPSKPSPALKVDTIISRFNGPWSLALLPNGKILVAERYGFLRIAEMNGFYAAPIAGVPDTKIVAAESLHDVVLDPDFAHNRMIYFTYFAPPPGETPGSWPLEYFYANVWKASVAERRSMRVGEERLASARLSDDERSLENVQVLLDGVNRRIVFAPDGTLFVTGADRFRFYEASYDGTDHEITDPDILRNFTGRVVRINKDGSIPKDNPFLDQPTVLPETYSYGHRDPEGAAINPATGKLWLIEHGPLGGDKISIIKPGGNYGWPNVSYGRRYNGDLVAGQGLTQKEGVEQPVYFWYPDIAPCALIFYTGDMFPEWKGNVLVGGMGAKSLIRLVLDGDKVVAEERLLKDLNQRVREVQQAPDGSLFILLDDGRLIRVSRK
ncbi:MAG TPA: PQQ-dependent sugar dehydrogenase [Candidatus Acidoferrales bacterium]|nr:PQQ-dependent sugar dehydrogenase [Candidatus Acidoferrales bacterium]